MLLFTFFACLYSFMFKIWQFWKTFWNVLMFKWIWKMLCTLQMQVFWKASHKENIKENKNIASQFGSGIFYKRGNFKDVEQYLNIWWWAFWKLLHKLNKDLKPSNRVTFLFIQMQKCSHKILLKGLKKQFWVELTAIWWNFQTILWMTLTIISFSLR